MARPAGAGAAAKTPPPKAPPAKPGAAAGRTPLPGQRPGSAQGASKIMRSGASPAPKPVPPPRVEVEEREESRAESTSRRAGGSGGQRRAAPAVRDEISGLRPTGMSLGTKFALLITITIAAACSLLFVSAYATTTAALDQEINDAGCRVARCMAAVGTEYWQEAREHTQRGKVVAFLNDFQKLLVTKIDAMGELVKGGGDAKVDEFNKLKNELTAELTPRQQALLDELEKFAAGRSLSLLKASSPEIVELFVTDSAGIFLTGIHPQDESKSIGLRGETSIGSSKDGISMFEGFIDVDGRTVPARQYGMKFMDSADSEVPAGQVVLFLSVQSIEEAKAALKTKMLVPLVLAIVIGVGVALYLSRSVTAPVNMLVADFNRVSQGDLDHHTIAHSSDEIGVLARSFNVMTKSLKAGREMALTQKAVEHEMKIAVEIQSNLLPKKLPQIPKWDIYAFYRPSKEVGGDYYDFIQIDQDHLGVICADVSGKGIPGSMVMGMARALIRMEAERNLSTADTLIKVNRILARDIKRGMFVTCMFIIVDLKTYQIKVTSAGHDPLILYRHQTKKFELINPNGIALGFDKGPIFERTVKEQIIQLYAGDRITTYTDGIPESMNPDSEEFGLERFYKMNTDYGPSRSAEFIEAVVTALDEHQGSGEQHDDITMVTLRILP